MIAWSSLKTLCGACVARQSLVHCQEHLRQNACQRYMSSHRVMTITPSRYQWHKFKDLLHYYLMVGFIPVGLIVFYANVFIGPAQLAEIPEDYVPKQWEYHQHPISRFLARYVINNPQQEYEKYCHYLHEESERAKIRLLEKKIRLKMSERHDYQAYYYRPAMVKYWRVSKEASEKLAAIEGDN